MTWRILNTYNSASYKPLLHLLGEVAELVTLPPGDEHKVPLLLADFDIYLASLVYKLKDEDVRNARRLKLVSTATTGTDHLPMEVLKERGVQVQSLRACPGLLPRITATAELAWLLLLALQRNLLPAAADVRAGNWRRERFLGHQLSGQTLGIVGYGRLGQIMGRYGVAFGMKVLATDIRTDLLPEHGVTLTSIDELLAQADVISLHIHLDVPNRHFFDARKMALMKRGAILINTSRGGIIDESALLAALQSKRLAAAGLDVLEGEWGDLRRHPLVQYAQNHDNLLITPHCGGAAVEAQAITFEETVKNILDFIRGSSPEQQP